MACLIDTGILLPAFDATCPEYRPIRRALRTLWSRQDRLIVALQNLAEFWNVSTRPIDKNGYGLSVERVSKRLARIEQVCDVVTEDDDSFEVWKGLLVTYSVSGVAVHDARLAAVMLWHGIPTIVTLNAQDFRRYSGISAISPSEV
ncbi:MAG: type II toxin-antitoxin system VapC family toxin [Pirellulales bacterium]